MGRYNNLRDGLGAGALPFNGTMFDSDDEDDNDDSDRLFQARLEW